MNKMILPITTLALSCMALLPDIRAVNPPPDGGYPGFNTAEGTNALNSLSTGVGNAAVGWFSLFSNTDGSFNTALGAGTLLFNIGDQSTGEGTQNTAIGTAALLFNNTGAQNTAVGVAALLNNKGGSNNTAGGGNALSSNTEGNWNSACGWGALASNTTGNANTASGFEALLDNATGISNTAIGFSTLLQNIDNFNTGVGDSALAANTTGSDNTSLGFGGLLSNITGDDNTAVGGSALANNVSGNANVAIGAFAAGGVFSADNVICIGAGVAGNNVSNTCFIGNIRGVTTNNANAIPVLIDSAGQLGTLSSSARFKKDIKYMNNASEAILALEPVTFHYKSDTTGTPQFGLIAEEVARVNPDLVVRDENGEIYTVRYDAVNAMLLNEFLKAHRKMQEQQKQIDALAAQLKEQMAAIQKMNAQFESRKPVPQVVVSNQSK